MSEPTRKRRWYRLAAVLLVLLIGYGTYRAVRPDPNLKKLKQLREEFTAQGKNWTPEQRQQKGQEMRAAMDRLSPSQRDALAAEGRQRFQQELERYSHMTAAEKTQYLDDRINQGERMRQQAAANGPRPGGGGPGGFGAGPGGPGGARGSNLSEEERDKRRRERLNQTTPEFRALMDQFRKDMNGRRQQRGLSVRG